MTRHQDRLCAAALWVVVAAVTLVRWRHALGNPAHTVDFEPMYRASGKLGIGGTMYQAGGYGYVYLPSAALLFAPLHLLSLASAASAVILLGLLSLSAACAVLVWHFDGPRWAAPASAAVLVGSEQALTATIFGNVDLVLPLLVSLAVVTWSARRSAVAYGLAIAVKPLILVPGIVAVLVRRGRWLGVGVATVLVLCLPGLLLTDVSRFFSDTIPFLTSGEPDWIIQVQSIAINSVLRTEPVALRAAMRLLALMVTVGTCVLLWRRPEVPERLRLLEVTVAGQIGLCLVNGFTLAHHAAVVLLLVPASVAAGGLARRLPVLAAALALAVPKPLPVWTIQAQQLAVLSALLGVLAVLAARSRSRRPAPPEPAGSVRSSPS